MFDVEERKTAWMYELKVAWKVIPGVGARLSRPRREACIEKVMVRDRGPMFERLDNKHPIG
jgi:hypothetical protein